MGDVDVNPAAFELMLACLFTAQAGPGQISGVAGWQQQVAGTFTAAAAYTVPAGSQISPAGCRVTGHDTSTHRRWLDLCTAIRGALLTQVRQADLEMRYWLALAGWNEQQREFWLDQAAAAETPSRQAYCVAQAESHDERRAACIVLAALAQTWRDSAAASAAAGEQLAAAVDRALRPIGVAIAAAGGVTEVAAVKQYHQT